MRVRLKATEFEAVRFGGPGTINVMGPKGEQTAKMGDTIIFHGSESTDREVIKKADFDEKYDVIAEEPAVDPGIISINDGEPPVPTTEMLDEVVDEDKKVEEPAV